MSDACGANVGASAATDVVIVRTLRGAWPSLPALLVASAAVCGVATVALLAAPGLNPVAVLVYALLGAPALAALAAVANAAAFDEVATIRGWGRALREHAGFAVRNGLIAAVPTILFLAALGVWTRGHPRWVLPSLALTGAAAVLATLGLLALLPLGVARPDLRGRRLWLTAGYLVARRPSRFVAVLCLAGVGVWAATSWSASVLLLLPGPAALVLAAAVWTTVSEVSEVGE